MTPSRQISACREKKRVRPPGAQRLRLITPGGAYPFADATMLRPPARRGAQRPVRPPRQRAFVTSSPDRRNAGHRWHYFIQYDDEHRQRIIHAYLAGTMGTVLVRALMILSSSSAPPPHARSRTSFVLPMSGLVGLLHIQRCSPLSSFFAFRHTAALPPKAGNQNPATRPAAAGTGWLSRFLR